MLVFVERCGAESAVEVGPAATVDDLKARPTDAVFSDGVELPDGAPLCDTGLLDGERVEVRPWTPVDVAALRLAREAPLPFPHLSALTADGDVASLSEDAETLLLLRAGAAAPPVAVGSLRLEGEGGDAARGSRRVSVRAVCASAEEVYVLTTDDILGFDLPAGAAPDGARRPAAVRIRVADLDTDHAQRHAHPHTLIYSPGGPPGSGVYLVSTLGKRPPHARAKDVHAPGCVPGVVVNLRVALPRVTAWCGAPHRRAAVAYDEGVQIYSLVSGAKVCSVGTPGNVVDVAWFPAAGGRATDRFFAAHKTGGWVCEMDLPPGDDVAADAPPVTIQLRDVAYPAQPSETPIRALLSPHALALASRYTVYLYQPAGPSP